MVRQVLLGCGVAASLLYVAMNLLGAMVWPGYSLTAQAISELGAIEAPARPLMVALGFVWDTLMIAFGVGVWRSAGRKPILRVVGALLVGLGVFGLTAPLTSMHQREVLAAGGATLTDTLHLVAAGIGSFFFLLTVGLGAAAFGPRFRVYSIGTILVMLVFGTLAALDGPRVQANLPTPWLGVTERTMFFSALLWFAVLALVLLRTHGEGTEPEPKGRELASPGRRRAPA